MQVLSGFLKPQGSPPGLPQPERPPRRSLRRYSSRNAIKEERTGSPGPSSRPSPSTLKNDYVHIADRSQIVGTDAEDPDLRDLNHSLVALAAIFPDIQVEVFRELLASFDGESRLALVTEALLKNNMKWVKGRYRVAGKDNAAEDPAPLRRAGGTGVAVEEKFRTAGYKNAVKNVTYQEFKGLSKSTINAVLAESNYSYMTARPTLVALSSKSWRFSISSLFLRRKQTSFFDAEHHPLVTWQSTGNGGIYPALKVTGSSELDAELFEALIAPLQQQILIDREQKDRALALEINEKEAEEHEALHDCECCFSSVTFEELSACNRGGHPVCFRCVKHAVTEAVFGQGWQRNIDMESGSLRCLAPMTDDCQGCISRELVERALLASKGGDDILRKLDERIAEDNLLKSNVPLVRCPFCSYAEIDEIYVPNQQTWRFRRNGPFALYTVFILIFGVCMIPFLLPVILVLSTLFLVLSSQQTFGDFTTRQLNASLTRLRRRKHGLKFTCSNPQCGRASCISCSKGWSDIHICHESSLQALRTQVELAMSLAIKRTCPRCNTSFVKSSGCNKLTCVCGYQMCYVCRKDIGNGEGYRHFCEHFRPNGGRGCTECLKCDLYRCEDDEIVVKKAKETAEKEWLEKEGSDAGDEKTRKALKAKMARERWWGKGGAWWTLRKPEWGSLLDFFVERFIE